MLLEPGGRMACMIPNYMQAWGLGRAYAEGVDAFLLVMQKEPDQYRWTLDVEGLKRAVTPNTNVILITNPNNPTGAILTAAEMDAVVDVARKTGAWLVVDEVYRGAEVQGGPHRASGVGMKKLSLHRVYRSPFALVDCVQAGSLRHRN